MDAFAVSICKGLSLSKHTASKCLIVGTWFGVFQGIMPLIGWFLGTQFEQYIKPVDHWGAFALLTYIGVKMIWDATHEKDDEKNEKLEEAKLDLKELLLLAIATSIDALAVGITFAVLQTPILPAIAIIGLTTFCLSWIGVVIGNRFGTKYEKKAEITGGVVLVLIGLKILLEHLGVINF